MSLRSSQPKRSLRLLSTMAITAGLFTGASGLAGAASTASHSSKAHSATSHASAPKPNHAAPANFHPGVVSAVTASSITLTLPDSSTTSYVINSATVVEDHDVTMSVADITVGSPAAVISSSADATVATKILIGVPGRDAPRDNQPHLGGQVVAVNASTITVADRDGFWRTIVTSAATSYRNDTSSTTRDTVVAGTFVEARGAVDANHTALDASSVIVSATAPMGPGGDHGPEGMHR